MTNTVEIKTEKQKPFALNNLPIDLEIRNQSFNDFYNHYSGIHEIESDSPAPESILEVISSEKDVESMIESRRTSSNPKISLPSSSSSINLTSRPSPIIIPPESPPSPERKKSPVKSKRKVGPYKMPLMRKKTQKNFFRPMQLQNYRTRAQTQTSDAQSSTGFLSRGASRTPNLATNNGAKKDPVPRANPFKSPPPYSPIWMKIIDKLLSSRRGTSLHSEVVGYYNHLSIGPKSYPSNLSTCNLSSTYQETYAVEFIFTEYVREDLANSEFGDIRKEGFDYQNQNWEDLWNEIGVNCTPDYT